MGVQGLWELLHPVGRPVRLETLANKRLAIDASIWLNQFLKAMRDSEGNMLRNAHLLGFFRRICKLLFYKIKPIFVFDGAAPLLKQKTLGERRRRQDRSTVNVKRTAEKLLSNQLRARALESAVNNRGKRGSNTKADAAPAPAVAAAPSSTDTKRSAAAKDDEHADNADDGDLPSATDALATAPTVSPATAAVPAAAKHKLNGSPAAAPAAKKRRTELFELPDVSNGNDAVLAAPQESDAPEEFSSFSLRSRFNDDYKGEFRFIIDEAGTAIDIDSAEFAALPPLVQHEIVAELTVRSRETSWARLRDKLNAAPTPIDFSLLQIRNTVRRSHLWSRMDDVRDSLRQETNVGGAESHRIVSEDAMEYILHRGDRTELINRLASKSPNTELVVAADDEDARSTPAVSFPPRGIFTSLAGAGAAATALLSNTERSRQQKTEPAAVDFDDLRALAHARAINDGDSMDGNDDGERDYEAWGDDDANLETEEEQVQRAIAASLAFGNEAHAGTRDHDHEDDDDNDDFVPVEVHDPTAAAAAVAAPTPTPSHDDLLAQLEKQIPPSCERAVPSIRRELQNLNGLGERDLNSRLIDVLQRKATYEDDGKDTERLAMVVLQNAIEALLLRIKSERPSPARSTTKPVAANERLSPARSLTKLVSASSPLLAPASSAAAVKQPSRASVTDRIRAINSQSAQQLQHAVPSVQGASAVNVSLLDGSDEESPAVQPSQHNNNTGADDEVDEQFEDVVVAASPVQTAPVAKATVAPSESDDDQFKEAPVSLSVSSPAASASAASAVTLEPSAMVPAAATTPSSTSSPAASKADAVSLSTGASQSASLGQSPNGLRSRASTLLRFDDDSQESDPETSMPLDKQAKAAPSITTNGHQRNINEIDAEDDEDINSPRLTSLQKGKFRAIDHPTTASEQPSRSLALSPPPTSPLNRDNYLDDYQDDAELAELRELSERINAAEDQLQRARRPPSPPPPVQAADVADLGEEEQMRLAIALSLGQTPTVVKPASRPAVTTPTRTPATLAAPPTVAPTAPPPAAPGTANDDTADAELRAFLRNINRPDADFAGVAAQLASERKSLQEEQRKNQRDNSAVTDDMIAETQELLKLFGVPFVIAPTEAEAQCAELERLNLVDGTVTDDADALLFGAKTVYKNMFNQNKFVEMYLASDIQRELGLDRGKLISLAYLLGSDYTDGLPGVGSVQAVEILKEFPGDDGLVDFARWWRSVYEGGVDASSATSDFKRRFIKSKSKKQLHIHPDFPDPRVAEAYRKPMVDDSEEPFVHALPDLDGLRKFVRSHLLWEQAKADESLLPVMKKLAETNLQARMEDFFGPATLIRTRPIHASERVRNAVSGLLGKPVEPAPQKPRKRKAAAATAEDGTAPASQDNASTDPVSQDASPKKKRAPRKPKAAASAAAPAAAAADTEPVADPSSLHPTAPPPQAKKKRAPKRKSADPQSTAPTAESSSLEHASVEAVQQDDAVERYDVDVEDNVRTMPKRKAAVAAEAEMQGLYAIDVDMDATNDHDDEDAFAVD